MAKTLAEILSVHLPASARIAAARADAATRRTPMPAPAVVPPPAANLDWHPAGQAPAWMRTLRAPERGICFVPAILLDPTGLAVPDLARLLDGRAACSVQSVSVSREERRLAQRRQAREAEDARRVADVAAAASSLCEGGLWRTSDIASAAGVTQQRAALALEALEGEGRAVRVALDHWRSRMRHADLVRDGRTDEARVLGCLLHGFALSPREAAGMAGVGEDGAAEALSSLVRRGLAERVGSRHRCPAAARASVVSALGPAPLTPVGSRVVDVLHGVPPSRKIEIADLLGMGRGSVVRAVERLVADGWLRPVGADRYALA